MNRERQLGKLIKLSVNYLTIPRHILRGEGSGEVNETFSKLSNNSSAFFEFI